MRRTLLSLFVAALVARVALSVLRVVQGVPPTLGNGLPWMAPIQTYDDFDYVYLRQLTLLGQGLIPYRDFAYSYPPLFLLMLYPFFGLAGPFSAGIPIILADAGTAPLVYLLTKRFASERVSLAASIFYALSPLALLYEGFLWFGSQPVTFFLLLSAYLLSCQRVTRSSLALGLASLLRSDALFTLPAYAIECSRVSGRRALRPLTIVIGMIVLASIPFLILSPGQYLYSMSYGTLAHVFPSTAGSSLPNATVAISIPSLSQGQTTATTSQLGWLFVTFGFEAVGKLLLPPLLALVLVTLLVAKGRRNSYLLSSSFSIMLFLAAFTYLVHPIFRYYLVPEYALLLAACTSPVALVVVSAASMGGLLLPETSFLNVLPLLSILGLIAAEEATRESGAPRG